MSSRSTDPAFLRANQYATGSNLNARIELHRRFTTAEVPFPLWLFEHLAVPESAQVLELGCGTGDLWSEVGDRVPSTWRLVLSDFSIGMLQEARAATSGLPCRVAVIAADAGAIPMRDGSADAVLANHMLYHVPDRDRAFEEIRRVLRPDGALYAATIGDTHLRQLHELVARFVSGLPTLHTATRRFSAENGAAQLSRWFGAVETERLDGELRVTEVEPVLAYIRSTGIARRFTPETFDGIEQAVRDEIETNGELVLDTRQALFTCRA